ncbi:MAG: MmoB/DmpM family protein [Candidatus Binatia bacterium]
MVGTRESERLLVGPVLRRGELAEAVAEAVRDDNPGKEVYIEEHASYVRIHTEDECIIRRETVEHMLGRRFEMQEIELNMSAFSGQIETGDDYIRFYLHHMK